jgi:hypothetical protein
MRVRSSFVSARGFVRSEARLERADEGVQRASSSFARSVSLAFTFPSELAFRTSFISDPFREFIREKTLICRVPCRATQRSPLTLAILKRREIAESRGGRQGVRVEVRTVQEPLRLLLLLLPTTRLEARPLPCRPVPGAPDGMQPRPHTIGVKSVNVSVVSRGPPVPHPLSRQPAGIYSAFKLSAQTATKQTPQVSLIPPPAAPTVSGRERRDENMHAHTSPHNHRTHLATISSTGRSWPYRSWPYSSRATRASSRLKST